jgi:hypothetical protein
MDTLLYSAQCLFDYFSSLSLVCSGAGLNAPEIRVPVPGSPELRQALRVVDLQHLELERLEYLWNARSLFEVAQRVILR